jgi:nitrogen fixation protein FixH
MVYYALSSFPGEAGGNAFDISNHYDAVLRTAEQEQRLGWSALASVDAQHPVVRVSTADGTALRSANVRAVALRPVGPDQRTDLAFFAAPDGRYVADAALPGVGRWDLSLTIEQGGRTIHVTRRVVIQ